jgi:tetratricopeptide (TPR) repeat protein
MKAKPASGMFIVLVLFILLVVLPPAPGNGQTPSPFKESPAAMEEDKKAMERLKKMSPEEVEALDKKLADALTLFYDGDYVRALPIFREISGKVETMDIRFWSATCAYKAGKADLAIKEFRKMLDVDPNLHQVRVELATAYYSAGEYEKAKNELKTVLKAQPPEPVRKRVEDLIAAIDEKTKRIYANIRFSQAIQWDSNVSTAPDRRNINPPAGAPITLRRTQREVSDWQTVTDFYGNVLVGFFGPKGLMWNTTGSYYHTRNFNHYKFDYLNVNVTTGPWWVGSNYVLKVPVGYSNTVYAHHDLFDTVAISPSLEYFITNNISVTGRFSYSHDSYARSRYYGLNNYTSTYELSPNFYFNNRNDLITLYASFEDVNAVDPQWSYDGFSLGISYLRKFPWGMEFYARYKYTNRDYKDPAKYWIHDREDDRHNVYVALSQNFLKYFFASLYFNWIDNESNTQLYDFHKTIYGLSLGFKY